MGQNNRYRRNRHELWSVEAKTVVMIMIVKTNRMILNADNEDGKLLRCKTAERYIARNLGF